MEEDDDEDDEDEDDEDDEEEYDHDEEEFDLDAGEPAGCSRFEFIAELFSPPIGLPCGIVLLAIAAAC